MNRIHKYIFRHETAVVLIPIILILTWPGLLRNFFNSTLMPHGHCYLWDPSLVWLHFSSDLLIGLAYIGISIGIGVLVYRARKDIPFHGMFIAFGLFILSCGFTHLMEVYTIWESTYWLSGSVKVVTAVASVATAAAIPIFVPKALNLISEAKISEERKKRIEASNAELKIARDFLQNELESKTADINTLIGELSERKKLIEQSLNEKETMLKEIHHRVKNNLQIVTSLLNLQIEKITDENNIEILNESKNRIKAMALIHEKLYHSEFLSTMAFGSYIRELVQSILQSYDEPANKVKIHIEYDELITDVDTAIPLALIVNELITNAVKYAFDDSGGIIKIMLKKTGSSEAELSISDNGRGLPPDLNVKEPDTLGLMLVNSLAVQVNATMEYSINEGTHYLFRFQFKKA